MTIRLLEAFDVAGDWEALGAFGTIAANTTEVATSEVTPPQSLKFTKTVTSGTSVNFRKTGLGNLDLTDMILLVHFYIHDGAGDAALSGINELKLQFANSDFGKSVNFSLGLQSEDLTQEGWYTRAFHPEMQTEFTGGTAREVLADIDNMTFSIVTDSNSDVPSVSVDKVMWYDELPTSLYIMTFDGGYANGFRYAAYLASKGLRANFGIHPSMVGSDYGFGYMTLDQLHMLKDMGHLITHHGWSRTERVISEAMTKAQYVENYIRAAQWMCNNGLKEGSRFYSNLGGSNEWEDEFFATHGGRYWDQIRVTNRDVASSRASRGYFDPRILYVLSFSNTTVADAQLALLDGVGNHMCSGWHSTDDDLGGSPATAGLFTFANWKTHVGNIITQRDAGTLQMITRDELFKHEYRPLMW